MGPARPAGPALGLLGWLTFSAVLRVRVMYAVREEILSYGQRALAGHLLVLTLGALLTLVLFRVL